MSALDSAVGARVKVVQNQARQADGEDHPCPYCPKAYESGAGLGGHIAWHRRRGDTTAEVEKVELVRLEEYCTCGAAIKLYGETEALATELLTSWQRSHAVAGHVSCSSEEARYVRNGYAVPRWLRAEGRSV